MNRKSSRNKYRNLKTGFIVFLFGAMALLPLGSFAQSSNDIALTITPPFFELNVSPGDSWSSSIRAVNTNQGNLPIRAVIMGFGAGDDQGHGSFIPLSQLAGDDDALANWISIPNSSFNVQQEGAVDIPFSITVPQTASPGGHYAAILIGTQPVTASGTSQVGVSSFISALIFVRVAGNVIESAQIQQFSTDKTYYQSPDVHFSVNVLNTGNVHVRPEGLIQIYNAFGKERGEISVNSTGNLGYVLPSSSREFDLEWQNQPSLLDIGPYTAVLSLAYGEDSTKSISRTIEFWILPIDQILEVLLGVILVAWIVTFVLRRIIRKMLASEISKYGGVSPSVALPQAKVEKRKAQNDAKEKSRDSGSKDSDVLDLRNKR